MDDYHRLQYEKGFVRVSFVSEWSGPTFTTYSLPRKLFYQNHLNTKKDCQNCQSTVEADPGSEFDLAMEEIYETKVRLRRSGGRLER